MNNKKNNVKKMINQPIEHEGISHKTYGFLTFDTIKKNSIFKNSSSMYN
jgi:hypothetical protein